MTRYSHHFADLTLRGFLPGLIVLAAAVLVVRAIVAVIA